MLYKNIKLHPLGFLMASEMPTENDLKKYYSEKYFQCEQGNYRQTYTNTELMFFENKIHQKFKKAQELGYFIKPAKFLDIGCGEGFALSYFRRLGWTVTGLDYSAAGLNAMNPTCIDVLKVGDVSTLLEENLYLQQRFEAIWLSNVLEHVPDPVKLLKQVKGLLQDNGLLVVTVPNDFSALQEFLLANGKVESPYWITPPDHLVYFNKDSLIETATHVGYKVHTILGDFPIDWFLVHSQTNYVRNRALGREAHHARLDLEALIALHPVEVINRFYEATANVGMGRDLTAFLSLCRT